MTQLIMLYSDVSQTTATINPAAPTAADSHAMVRSNGIRRLEAAQRRTPTVRATSNAITMSTRKVAKKNTLMVVTA